MAYQVKGTYNDDQIRQNSAETYRLIQEAKNAWETAHAAGDTTGMAAAHQTAERLRSSYGYSGGEDGSQYIANSYAPVRAQYQDAANSAAEVYRLAAEQGAARLAGQRSGISAQYDDLARQAYANYMLEQKALPQTMARLGLAGQGTAETTAARQSSAYQQNVLLGEQARAEALQGLENKIADLLATGELKGAQAQADAAMETAKGYQAYLAAQQKQQNYESERAEDARRWQAEMEQAAGKQQSSQQAGDFSRQMAVAKILAEYGDFSGYAALGFNPDQIAQMERAWRLSQAGK